MNSIGDRLIFPTYRCGLALFPREFRERNAEQMLQAVSDALYDPSVRRLSFCWMLFIDLIQSCIKEHSAMLPERIGKHAIAVHALGLGLVLSLLGGLCMQVTQQLLRKGADQPQQQMVDLAASRLAGGETLDQVIPPAYVELGRDLQPFLIYYNDRGEPLHGTGYLDQKLPSPPPGVFEYLRSHPTDAITWQPRNNLRIATVLQRVNGPQAGFLLAGRDMVLVEKQESLLYHLSVVSWIIVLALLALGASLLSRNAGQHAQA
jgi:hypothetical protein